ncbi:hypothetical protein [Arthrobacter sp. R1-13]
MNHSRWVSVISLRASRSEGPMFAGSVSSTCRSWFPLDSSGQQITKVDDAVHAALFNVGQHCVKGQQVAMDIGNDSDSHLPTLIAVL